MGYAAGPLIALMAFALFAAHDVAVKLLGADLSPVQIVFFGTLFSFPLATLLLIRDPNPGHLRPIHPYWSALRTAAAVTTGLCAFYAFSVLPLAQVYALIFASPLFVTVLSVPVLGERVGPHRWGAVAMGLLGVMVVLRPFGGGADLQIGHAAALVAAFGSALASVVVRRIGRAERGVVLLIYPMLANVVLMGALLPAVYRPMSLTQVGLVGVVSLFSFVAGFLMIAAYRRAEAAIVAPMQYSQILWAALWGWLVFEEGADWPTWAGAAVVIASGLYVVVQEARGRSLHAPVTTGRIRPETGTSPRIAEALRARAAHVPPPGHEVLRPRR